MDALDPAEALAEYKRGGGMLYPFRHGYERLGVLLDAVPPETWRRDEDVLGGLVLLLTKHGQTARAKSYLHATNLEFERTYIYDILDLLLELHLGVPVSDTKLASWSRLERDLPLSDPLILGLYYNAMMAMFVRVLQPDDARVAGHKAISCYREAGHIYLEHFIHIHLADLDVVEGRLRRAARGLKTAERCLEASGVRYANEDQVIEVIRLAIDYERGHLEKVRHAAPRLRNGLVTGDSWSELFYQLARISVMSCFFLEGRAAAQTELEIFQADYARRHGGIPLAIDVLEARINYLEWQPNKAERQMDALGSIPIHSAIGHMLRQELRQALAPAEPLGDTPDPVAATPRDAIVSALQTAQGTSGKARRQSIERAMRLALEEGQIAPFLEHRDVFLGVSTNLSSGQAMRGNMALTRLAKRITQQVDHSYVVPDKLRALGFNRRQYRVAAAVLSGSSNKQVARQLGTSEATVKYHLTSIYRLAGVEKRRQFIDFALSFDVFEIS